MKIDIYLHGSKETAWEKAEAAGLTGDALGRASYMGCEHKMTYEVDAKTGEARLIAVDDRVLSFLKIK